MAKPQQPELARNGHSPADPASVKTARTVPSAPVGGPQTLAPIPEDNLPGHHPDHEQDKPTEAFVEKAKKLAAEARSEQAAPTGAGRVSAGAGTRPSQAKRANSTTRPNGATQRPTPSANQQTRSPRADANVRAPSPSSGPVPLRPATEVGPSSPSGARHAGIGAFVPAVAILDAMRRPQRAWDEIGESRAAWMARIAAVPLASWRYDTKVRPRLEAADLALSLAGG